MGQSSFPSTAHLDAKNHLVSCLVKTEAVHVNKLLMKKCMFDGASSKPGQSEVWYDIHGYASAHLHKTVWGGWGFHFVPRSVVTS